MISKKQGRGFTIVELLIVIVVIGILAALVVTTYNGIQQRARNTERQTDINALHGQVEAYYADQAYYPTLADMQSDAWISANLLGLDLASARAPGAAANTIVGAGAAIGNYEYVVTPAGCDNAGGGNCTDYTLTATRENDAAYVKQGLN